MIEHRRYDRCYERLLRRLLEGQGHVHEAEEGGYWGEVPAIPGCASQGKTLEELMANLHEAINWGDHIAMAEAVGSMTQEA